MAIQEQKNLSWSSTKQTSRSFQKQNSEDYFAWGWQRAKDLRSVQLSKNVWKVFSNTAKRTWRILDNSEIISTSQTLNHKQKTCNKFPEHFWKYNEFEGVFGEWYLRRLGSKSLYWRNEKQAKDKNWE